MQPLVVSVRFYRAILTYLDRLYKNNRSGPEKRGDTEMDSGNHGRTKRGEGARSRGSGQIVDQSVVDGMSATERGDVAKVG